MTPANSDGAGEAATASRRELHPHAQGLRGIVRGVIHGIIAVAVSARPSRRAANALYNRLGTAMHERLQRRFAKVFRGRAPLHAAPDKWTVRFGSAEIGLPLSPHRMWLDWDAALSTLGHEVEIKQTYATLLAKPDRPTLFMDVGANYGTHSLIFLVHGVDTLTFEPNATCHEYFLESCKINGVSPRLEPIALGEAAGIAELSYPENETWLGSIDRSTVMRLEHEATLIRSQVPVRPLDDYVDVVRGKRVLIKIDAEGHEVPILRGARRLLAQSRPWVVFESWSVDAKKRREILRIFLEAGYRIARLPLLPDQQPRIVAVTDFVEHPDSDFVAIPA